MRVKGEDIVNLIEELIDLKVRQTILVQDLADSKSYAQSRMDLERMQTVKLRLTTLLDG